MQNTGIDYVMDDTFDVVSIYEGTVIDVMDDELLGKLKDYSASLKDAVVAKDKKLQEVGYKQYK